MLTEKQRTQAAARQQRFRKRQLEARRREQSEKGLPSMPAISTMPGHARWRAALKVAQTLLEQVRDEMENYYDERSESWQEGDAGTLFDEHQQALESTLTQLDEVAL